MDWLQDVIHRALKAHGVAFEIASDGAAVLTNGLSIHAENPDHTDHGHGHVLRLDFVFSGGPLGEHSVAHCLAGVGETVEGARRNGVDKFLGGAFHTVLEALADHRCDHPQAGWETWATSEVTWNVAISPLIRTGADSPASSLETFLDALKIVFLAQARLGVQFIDVFFAHLDGERYASEVKLNGEPWPEGLSLLERWRGPTSEAYSTGRLMLIASPAS